MSRAGCSPWERRPAERRSAERHPSERHPSGRKKEGRIMNRSAVCTKPWVVELMLDLLGYQPGRGPSRRSRQACRSRAVQRLRQTVLPVSGSATEISCSRRRDSVPGSSAILPMSGLPTSIPGQGNGTWRRLLQWHCARSPEGATSIWPFSRKGSICWSRAEPSASSARTDAERCRNNCPSQELCRFVRIERITYRPVPPNGG